MPEVLLRPARLEGLDNEVHAIVQLAREALGDAPTRTVDFFRWKHLDNPFGESFVWVAEDEGRLVALRAMMRWELVSKGRRVRAVRPVDTATHPSHRRRGLFKALTTRMVEELGGYGIDLIFNTPNPQSRSGYLKMGWQDLGRPAVFLRPGGRFSRQTTAPTGTTPVGMRLPMGRRLSTPRDRAYLGWRFSQRSLANYRLHRIHDVAVYSRQRLRDARQELTICDLIVPQRRQIGAAASLLRQVVRATTDDYALGIAASGSREAAVLLLAGFVPVSNRGPVIVARRVPGQPASPATTDLAAWRLQVGDLEIF